MTDSTGTLTTRSPRMQSDLFHGRWTREEEKYAEGIMEEFRDGSLSIATGTKLRGYIAEKLSCFPKRVSKKYECSGYNGRQQYVNRVSELDPVDLKKRAQKLEELREKFAEKRAAKVKAKNAAKTRTSSATTVQDKVEWARFQERGLPHPMAGSISGGSSTGFPIGNSLMGTAGHNMLMGASSRFTGAFPFSPSFGSSFQGEDSLTESLLGERSMVGPLSRATGVNSTGRSHLKPSTSLVTPRLELDRMMLSLNGPSAIMGELQSFPNSWLQAEAARRSLVVSETIRAEYEKREILQKIHARRAQLERCLSQAVSKRDQEQSKRSGAWNDALRGAPKRMRHTSS